MEAGRPDTITKEKLRLMKLYGVNRISINPQTMNEETLKRIGRRHTVEDIRRVFWEAREGHDNINMDLILGLPRETPEDVRQTMEEIMALEPDNATVHTLAVKRASRLKEQFDLYTMTDSGSAAGNVWKSQRIMRKEWDWNLIYVSPEKYGREL